MGPPSIYRVLRTENPPISVKIQRERCGSVVESRIPEREVRIRSLHTPCCVLEQDIFLNYFPKTLVIPRKQWLHSGMTKSVYLGRNPQHKHTRQLFSEMQLMHRKLPIADIHSCTPRVDRACKMQSFGCFPLVHSHLKIYTMFVILYNLQSSNDCLVNNNNKKLLPRVPEDVCEDGSMHYFPRPRIMVYRATQGAEGQ